MVVPRAFIFDAYGTLFDVHSVVEAGRALTSDPQALSNLWRQKQLEYTWLRSLMDRYVDFWTVTQSSLSFALRRLGLQPGPAQAETLLDAYLTLAPFPEVKAALAALAYSGLAVGAEGVTIAFRPSWQLGVTGLAVSLLVGLIAGVVPAWQAARTQIVAALRA